MWSFYFNYGTAWILKNFCRDGFICYTPEGLCLKWQTISKGIGFINGIFKKENGDEFSRQKYCWTGQDNISVYYFEPMSDKPSLVYECVQENNNTLSVKRTRGEVVDVYKVVCERDEQGLVTSYAFDFPDEEAVEIRVEYNDKDFLSKETIITSTEKTFFEYIYDDNGILVSQKVL